MHPSWNDYPHLVAELDPDGNRDLTFFGEPIHVLDLAAGTNKRLDWKCRTCQHQWRTAGSNRSHLGNNCPYCDGQALHSDGRNSMAITHPELALEYQGDATEIMAGTGRKLPWKCLTCEHEWMATGDSRKTEKRNRGCPCCANLVVHSDGRNSMEKTHPELALEYQGDATKVLAGTHKKLPWKCKTCGYKWLATGYSRKNNHNSCSVCRSMATTHPELALEYQGDATKVNAGTNKKLPWKCLTCEHEWKATGHSRSLKNNGCPACSGHSVHSDGRNSMAVTHPELAQEYQGDATKIIAGTGKKLLWKCRTCEHTWKTVGANRCNGSGCPCCADSGFQIDKPAHYYVHKILNESGDLLMYKGGISGDWKKRLRQLRRKLPEHLTMELHEVIDFEVGQEARDLEIALLRMAAEEDWKAPPRDFDGGHELFFENPLDHARKQGLIG